jgi:long-chain acyl-CoA synthetase
VLTVNPADRAKAGSVGPPLPGVEIELRNQNLEGVGEVWAKGPNIMPGYLENPEATRAVLNGEWFRTGDLGRLDDEDYLFLTGRSTDLIVTSAGKNVYPDEVEARYADLPYAKEVCVFGVPSEDGLGDEVHAVVVLDEAASPALGRSSVEREIRLAVAEIGEGLPSHQRVAVLHFWERELPKTSTLKAKRGRIRDVILAERTMGAIRGDMRESADAAPASVESSAEDRTRWEAVRRIVARRTKLSESAITEHMHLHLDLGIDSIGKMDVITEVETVFGMTIDGARAAEIARVKDLVTVIGDRSPKTVVTAKNTSAWQRRLSESTGYVAMANGKLPPPLVPVRWLVRGGVAAFMKSYVRVRAVGREHIPAAGPFILAPNHSSHLDTPAVLTAVGRRRRVWIAGAEDYFFNSSLKRLVFGKLLDTIPFDRQTDGIVGLRRCCGALRRGDGLLIFPEGTRSPSGELQPFKIGVAVLCVELGVPIVPVHIHRAFDLLPKGKRFVKPGSIVVRFGEPIGPPAVSEDDDRHEKFRELAAAVERSVARLSAGASRA